MRNWGAVLQKGRSFANFFRKFRTPNEFEDHASVGTRSIFIFSPLHDRRHFVIVIIAHTDARAKIDFHKTNILDKPINFQRGRQQTNFTMTSSPTKRTAKTKSAFVFRAPRVPNELSRVVRNVRGTRQ